MKKQGKRWLNGVILVVLSIIPFFTSCATIIGGGPKSPSERTSEIRWGYFILDLLTTGPLGLIVDFVTGAIYESKRDKYSSLYKEMIEAAKKGMSAYIVKNDVVILEGFNV